MDIFNRTIYELNTVGALITIDGVLQFDDSKTEKKQHKSSYEIEVANKYYSSLYYIDLWNWIQEESRKHCMGRDYTGIHFTNDDVRLLHVQAFLNYVHFFKYYSHR